MSRRLSSSASGMRPAAFFDFSPPLSSARLTMTSALICLRVVRKVSLKASMNLFTEYVSACPDVSSQSRSADGR